MRNWTKMKILAIVAVAALLFTTTGITLAYFSDYEPAAGEAVLGLSGHTVIDEKVTDTEKTIKIHSPENNTADVVVRIAIYGPDELTDGDKENGDISLGKGWIKSKNSEYYYYDKLLAPGESTTEIVASIKGLPLTVELSDVEIIVQHETAVAVYKDDNTVKCPDGWESSVFPTIKAPALGQ